MNSTAIVFPGQGSQSLGMLGDIAREYPDVMTTFAEASEIVGFDLWKLTQDGPQEELDKTINTQPALLTASYAIWKILKNKFKPVMFAGHSLGEYTALVCADALSFADAVKLVRLRGEFMQDAVPQGQGALAAIVGLDDDTVKMVCQQAAGGETLAPANYNSPGQIVIAGTAAAVERGIAAAKNAGAKLAKCLPVSVPSHCDLMKPAAERLAKNLAEIDFRVPVIPVVSNVDVAVYQTEISIRDGLVRQLYKPVRWVETMQKFAAKGVTSVIECGPGKVLSGLNKRINANLQLANTSDLANLQSLLEK